MHSTNKQNMKKTQSKQTVKVELLEGKKMDVQQSIMIETDESGDTTAIAQHFGDEIVMSLENMKKFYKMIGEAIVKHEKPIETVFYDWPSD